jgi:hypothetical protein
VTEANVAKELFSLMMFLAFLAGGARSTNRR